LGSSGASTGADDRETEENVEQELLRNHDTSFIFRTSEAANEGFHRSAMILPVPEAKKSSPAALSSATRWHLQR
jgi:hypothetical protein